MPPSPLLDALTAAIAQLDEGVIIADAAGRITFVNAAAARLHGVARLDVPPDRYAAEYSLFREDGRPYPSDELPLARAVVQGETIVDGRWRIRRPDGSEILAVGTARPLLGPAGERLGAVLTVRDESAHEAGEAARRERDTLARRLSSTFEQSPVSTVIYDATGRPLASNAAFERLWGAAQRDVPAGYSVLTDPQIEAAGLMPLLRRAFGLDGARSPEGAGEAVTTPPIRYDMASPVGRGRTLWTQGHLYPVRDATGAVERVVLTHEDVTLRLEAESALADSERQLRILADGIPTLAWTARADGFIDWYNKQWFTYTGTTPEQMEGWGWQDVHDPDVLPQVLVQWTRSIETGQPFAMTFPLRSADGQFRRFLTRVTPLLDADGRVLRWFGTNTDVEDERLARDAAVSAAARTQRLQTLTAALAGTRTLDDVARIVVAEGRAATNAATGMVALHSAATNEVVMLRAEGIDEELETRYARFSVETDVPSAEAIRTGAPVWLTSAQALRDRYPALTDLWAQMGTESLAAVPLLIGDAVQGALSFSFTTPHPLLPEDREFFLAVGREAAQAVERARLLSAEQAARAAAEAANKAKGDFLAAMSHELRTPLNAIGGYAQLLELGVHGPVTEMQMEAIKRIQRSGSHLLSLINDVLNFAKLEAGRVEYRLENVRVAAVVAQVSPMLEPQLAAKRLIYDVDVPEEYLVCADSERLLQILLNLLSNSIKFTDEGGVIRIDVEADPELPGERVLLHVTDSGIGIPLERQASLFDPFVQVHRNLTRSTEGTGLGLAISRDLARGMGGDLVARSVEGEGSTFTLSLERPP